MTFHEWRDDIEMDLPHIDQQHRFLLNLVRQYESASSLQVDGAIRTDVVACLKSYIHLHFADEERLMLETGYEGYDEHKQEHDRLAARVDQLVSALGEHGNEKINISDLLREWITEHIMKSDRGLAEWLKVSGTKTSAACHAQAAAPTG